jgi:thioredoxin-like negative regulator of GroEL
VQAETGDQRLELSVDFGTAAGPGPETAQQPPAAEPPAGFQSDFAAAQAAAAKQGRPLVVVFGASWCASCKALERAFADPSLRDLRSRVVCVWVDTDQNSRLADQHQIREIPHLQILGPDGGRLVQHVGYAPPATIAKLLAQALESRPDRTAPGGGDAELQQEIRRLRQEIEQLRDQLRRLEERAKSGGR